jgi:hypothetical protein
VVGAGRQETGFQIPFPPLLLNNIFGAKDYIIYCTLMIMFAYDTEGNKNVIVIRIRSENSLL